jgi:hypothetical protein
MTAYLWTQLVLGMLALAFNLNKLAKREVTTTEPAECAWVVVIAFAFTAWAGHLYSVHAGAYLLTHFALGVFSVLLNLATLVQGRTTRTSLASRGVGTAYGLGMLAWTGALLLGSAY